MFSTQIFSWIQIPIYFSLEKVVSRRYIKLHFTLLRKNDILRDYYALYLLLLLLCRSSAKILFRSYFPPSVSFKIDFILKLQECLRLSRLLFFQFFSDGGVHPNFIEWSSFTGKSPGPFLFFSSEHVRLILIFSYSNCHQ